ncbi:MAG: Cell division protein ftsA [candidate division TM6 bacterium GW2011_GWF2_38_10]|nr:MAG: Cell division protein ftsA [candidate division TM6 bacterium GW2011_GWF2_38_10]
MNITAIDIGTTKICVIIASINTKGVIEILGIGQHPSHGLKKGVVVNIAKTVESLEFAIKQAEEMAGIKIEKACVGISGGHIQSRNSTGVVAVKNKTITQYDIDRVIEAAKAIPIQQDQEILHVLPQYFRVDGQEQVLDSKGMFGVRLEAQVHIVTGAIASAQNIIKSCELAGLDVSDIVLEQIASAQAVLTPFEKELGVGILDIGGGTSDFAIYKDGRIRHSKVIPFAGNHFTNDLAIGLGIPLEKAEEIKKQYATVSPLHIQQQHNKFIDIDLGYNDGIKTIEVGLASEMLRFRAEEIIDILIDEILDNTLKNAMPAGLVLTGGGCLLPGFKEIIAQHLGIPVRIGYPQETQKNSPYTIPDALKSPIYSTAFGLLLYAINEKNFFGAHCTNHSMFGKIFGKMKSWLYDFF